MYKIDKLTLISGIDIPIPEMGVSIHQPTIREIAYIGELNFYTSAQSLTLKKEDYINLNIEKLTEEDKTALSKMSNFQLIMMIAVNDNLFRIGLQTLLTLLFPTFTIQLEERFIMLVDSVKNKSLLINENNFSVLQEVVEIMLCLHSSNQKEDFNPIGDRAKAIAEKIKKGREKAARAKGEANKQSSILSRYISGLGIGTQSLNILNILDLTLYQFFDQMERFGLRESYNIGIKAKMAGAKDVEDVDWLKDIEK